MSTQDTLQRFIFDKLPIRGEFVHLDQSFQTIVSQHRYSAPIKQLLGEALCVAALLSAIIKFNGRLTVQFRGKGPLKLLLAQCDNEFQLRGLVKCDGEPTYGELMDAMNEGVLVIMLDGGPKKTRYQGIVSWRGNSLIESIEGYFKESEQLATKIWLSVNETSAVGFLLQIVPTKGEQNRSIEKEIIEPHWRHIQKLSSSLCSIDMLHIDFESLLRMVYPEEEIRIFPVVDVKFGCTCSRKRGADAIMILGREEAEEELRDKQVILVTCDFCNREYVFDRVDVAAIFENKNGSDSNTHLH